MNNKNKIPYFHELSLDKMLENHDWYYQYSDDNRYYERGSKENDIIHNKIKELGGWCPRIVTMWNKHAPKSMETDMEWQNMIKKL
tara:strand:+ start:88 stop:342 length:255 start_codon:yes stop_codon:yes gene_type:complete